MTPEKAARMYARREGKVTPYAIGRMVLESQAPQAVRQQQIVGIAVRTAQDMGVNLKEYAEPIAVVAARANIPMEFVSESSLAPRRVGNIPPVNRTATSPQANVEHPTHLGDVGNLPSGVPGAAGLQSTAGETAAAGVTPSGAEASAPPPSSEGGKETVPSGQYARGKAPAKADVAQYTEKDYNSFGWACVNGVLTAAENAQFWEQFAYNRNLQYKYTTTSMGETIIPVGQDGEKLIYVIGTYENPKITRVVEINSNSEHTVVEISEILLECEAENYGDAYEIVRAYAAEGILTEYKNGDFAGYRELVDRGGEGASGGDGTANRGESGDGGGSLVQYSSDVGEISEELRSTDKNGNIFFGAMYDRENGKILINADAIKDGRITVGQSLDFFLKHELTHKIEKAGAWNTLAKLARREMGAEAFDAQVQAVQQHRAADGDTVGGTPEGAKKEVVADWVGTNLFKKEFAKVMAKEYKGFANNLVLTFSGLRRGLAATEKGRQAARMKYAEQLYLKALAESAPDVTDEQIAARLEEVLGRMAEDGQPTAEDAAAAGVAPSFDEGKETVPSGQYSIAVNARADVEKALTDKNYTEDVYLTDSTPSIIVSQKGVRNLPMTMKASHLRTNVFTEQEAKAKGFKIKDRDNYHGLGKDLFLNIINSLDDVTLAYRGTKNADNPERRENYFLLISQYKDSDGNTINVPIYINQTGQHNNVVMDVNKIATVFGRNSFNDYIQKEMRNGNLVRIKNRSIQASELKAPIASSYSKNTSNTTVPQNADGVNSQFMQNGGENSPTAGQRAQMTPEIAAQLQKNQAEIDERNRRRGIQRADAQAELDAVVDNDVDSDADVEDVVDLSSDNVLAERIDAQSKYGLNKHLIIQNYILELLKGKEIVLSDGRKVIVDNRDANHISYNAGDKKTAQISKIKELIETAQLYAEDSRAVHNKFDYFWYYRAIVRYEGDVFPIYLNVGRAKNDGKYHLYDITKNLRDTADRINGLERPKPNEGYALGNGVSTDSISDFGENVNGKFDLSTPEGLRAQAAALEKRAAQLERKKQQLSAAVAQINQEAYEHGMQDAVKSIRLFLITFLHKTS